MTRSRLTACFLALGVVLVVAGCGSDSGTSVDATVDTPPSRAVVGAGEASDDFLARVSSSAGEGMDFLLRGSNVRTEEGALLVDVVVVNEGDAPVMLPAALTFVSLAPAGVTVDGADNGETGAGASFALGFAERDLEWSVGEESLPLTLSFGVESGVSVAFAARVDVEMSEIGGSIGGTVFVDRAEDGVFGGDERRVPNATVILGGADVEPARVRTSADGTFRFDGLEAGAYTVRLARDRRFEPSGASELQVLLVDDGEGGVADFLAADFGVIPVRRDDDDDDDDRPGLQTGDHVEVTGRYDGATSSITAWEIEFDRRDDDDDDGDDEDDRRDGDEDHNEFDVRGPVTAVDRENGVLSVMGIDLEVGRRDVRGGGPEDECKDRPALDFDVRERARVSGRYERMRSEDGPVVVLDVDRVMCWSGNPEKIAGRVERIARDDDGRVRAFSVLGLRIDVTRRTEIDD